MATMDVPQKGGFSFDLCRRNEMLVSKGLRSPSFLKTGTTIVGLIFQVGCLFSCLLQTHFVKIRFGLVFVCVFWVCSWTAYFKGSYFGNSNFNGVMW